MRAQDSQDGIHIQITKIETDKELALKEMELQAQAHVNTDATSNPPGPNRDAKSRNSQLSWMRRVN